jgi:nucleotide-binding universal stress UspA family protein
MQPILAPTDFSDNSRNAVFYAADLAQVTHSALILLSVVHYPVMSPETLIPASVMEDMLGLINKEMNVLVSELKARTGKNLAIHSEVIAGSVEEEIKNMAGRYKPLAIIMGMKPGKSIERALTGNTTLHTIKHVADPVIMIPAHAVFKQIKGIGIACDLEKIGEKFPFKEIRQWITLFNAKSHILYVTLRNKKFGSEQMSGSVTLQNQMQSFNPELHFLNGDNLSDVLNEFITNKALDLFVVIPKQHGIFGVFTEKNSNKIISRTPIPVLVLHEH